MYPHQSGGQERNPPPLPPPPGWQVPAHSSAPQAASSSQPPNGAYPPASYPPLGSLPPLSEHQRDMALSYQPPPPPPSAPVPTSYQYPPPHNMAPYSRPPDSRYAAHPYPPQHQPAPRQRTAIACRYCRRRKIRCSGFDSSEDGRCSNCQRFSQECVFTPVSAQTQAFVPAHAVFNRGGAQPTQLYGAYGQPLPPPQPGQDPYARPPPHYSLPSPASPYGAAATAAPPPPSGYAPAPYDDRNGLNGTRKRPANEPHTPTLPPPNPATTSVLPRTLGHDYRYPDPTSAPTPGQPEAAQQPYYASQAHPQRSPPTLASPYPNSVKAERSSSSPRASLAAPGTPGSASYPPYSPDTQLQPPGANLPIRSNGRTPPPATSTPGPGSTSSSVTTNGHQQGTGRPSMSISSIVSGDGSSPGTRSTTDSAMLKKLGK